jgi:hypothetical protein
MRGVENTIMISNQRWSDKGQALLEQLHHDKQYFKKIYNM